MIAGVLCLLFKNDSRFCVKGAFKKDGLGVAKAEAKQNFCWNPSTAMDLMGSHVISALVTSSAAWGAGPAPFLWHILSLQFRASRGKDGVLSLPWITSRLLGS